MKRVILTLMVLSLLVLGGQSFAEMCTIDAVPAATLLVPYFATDISDGDGDGAADCTGIDTIFSINNASAAPALAHVTLWTDWTWPSLDFDVFLTGYDIQSVSLCNVIGNGSLPVTADEQNDGDDTISPHGSGSWLNPDWDGSFPNCAGVFPFPDPIVTGGLLDRVQNAHAGYGIPQLGGDCTGQGLNGAGSCSGGSCPAGTIARGYVTIDNVSECSTVFPNEPDYFEDGGLGIANDINQLWGEVFQIDPVNDFAQGDNLVHIEADPNFNDQSTPSGYTYYGRYVTNNPGGGDNREPLGTTWAARTFNFGVGTQFTVWRDSTDDQVNNNDGWDCGLCDGFGIGPDWCPMNETQVVCFDEAEHAIELCFIFGGGVISPPDDPSDPTCFPLETQMVQYGADPMDPGAGFEFGWCFLNLNHTCTTCSPGGFGPNGDIAQSWVGVNHSALGIFSAGHQAIELTSACSTANPTITGNIGN